MNARTPGVGLSGADRERLVKLCGMLGSAHDGERAAAGLLASRLLRERGLRWDDVIGVSAPLPPPQRPASSTPDCPVSRLDAVRLVLARADLLTPWEVGFVQSVARRRRWSPKQIDVFDRIHERVRTGASGRRGAP